MTEKIPPVLSEKQVLEWLESKYGIGYTNEVTIIHPNHQKEAQRDADVEWYGDKLNEVQERQAELEIKLNDVDLAIQQARQEGRDDVLAILENDYPEEAQSIKQALKGSKEKMK